MRTAAIVVFSTPKFGCPKSRIRFLGRPRGLITHWVKKLPEACPGPELCRQHHLFQVWKGFAPAQLWSTHERAWFPVVFEVTSGLIETIGQDELRGQSWDLKRVDRGYGKKAIEGKLVTTYDFHDIPKAFDVVPIVERLFKTTDILWDVPCELWIRPVAEVSDEVRPAQPLPAPQAADDNKAARQRFQEQKRELFKMPNGVPRGK